MSSRANYSKQLYEAEQDGRAAAVLINPTPRLPFYNGDVGLQQAWLRGYGSMSPGQHRLALGTMSTPMGGRAQSYTEALYLMGASAHKKKADIDWNQSWPCRQKLDIQSPINFSTPKESTVSNRNYLFAQLVPGVVGVVIRFEGTPRHYTYKALDNLNLAEGDSVVVQSPSSGKTVVTVVEVLPMDKVPDDFAGYKWIIGKVDCIEMDAIRQQEVAFLTRLDEITLNNKRREALAKLAEEVGGAAELKKLLAEILPPTKAAARRKAR